MMNLSPCCDARFLKVYLEGDRPCLVRLARCLVFRNESKQFMPLGWCSRDLLEEQDKIRKLRNRLSHSWDIAQFEPAPDEFISTRMDNIEHYFAKSVKSPRDYSTTLGPHSLFRLRLLWIVGRTYYECRLFVPAMKARIEPRVALFGPSAPKLLGLVTERCGNATLKLT